MNSPLKNIDTKEIELPETIFIRDIEGKVFQSIVVQTLATIEGVALLEGNFIDSLLGRDAVEGVKGIQVDQDLKTHSVSLKIEINVAYGICIPEKAEEVQMKIAEKISRFTGLHVAAVHVIFKNLISLKNSSSLEEKVHSRPHLPSFAEETLSEFSEEF
ncbi:MAG: Asp23/Gls24 family envelope stress response protein [Chlamydiae bacterium]|nr:Asp23/Gls24 family envelope stress response protein [Chlamydiota bacterium]